MRPPAGQDSQLSTQSALTLIYSGVDDPSVIPTRAVIGTIYLGTGAQPGGNGGKAWIKQDDGLTTNWNELVEGGNTAAPSGSRQLFVDPVSGNDTSGKPFATIAAAFARAAILAGPPDSTCNPGLTRVCVVLLPGRYLEPAPTLPYNVSLMGYGMDNTIIVNGLNYVGALNEAGRSDISNIAISGPFNCNLSQACNTNIRFLDSRANNLIWNGGTAYGTLHFSNFLGHSSTFGQITIVDGAVHLYDNQGVFSGIDVQDGPAANSLAFLEICGGLVQGAVTMAGKAQIYARGILFTASLSGTVASGSTPLFETDRSSLPTGAITGTVKILVDDELLVNTAANFTVVRESYVIEDASAGNVLVTLPPPGNLVQSPVTIKKADSSSNTVGVAGVPVQDTSGFKGFTVLAATTATNTGSTVVNGDLGISPGNSLTGFPPGVVNGTTHLADAAAAAAQTALTNDFTAKMALPFTSDLSGQVLGTGGTVPTLTPGVYKFTSSCQITGALTLNGAGDYIFQIGSTLTTAAAASIVLAAGATAARIFWIVGSSATLGTTTSFIGTIEAQASITLTTGASLAGRALARTGAVTMDTNAMDHGTLPVVIGTFFLTKMNEVITFISDGVKWIRLHHTLNG